MRAHTLTKISALVGIRLVSRGVLEKYKRGTPLKTTQNLLTSISGAHQGSFQYTEAQMKALDHRKEAGLV